MDPIPTFPQALRYARQVQARIAGNRRIYDQFLQTLQLFRLNITDSWTAISTIHEILNDHPTLLDNFKPFIPKDLAAAAARAKAEDAKVTSCVGFLNRVGARFNGGRAYSKFLEYCMHARARGQKDTSDRVSRLFGDNYDLYEEFLRFLPESRNREGQNGQYFTLPRGTKRSRDDEETSTGDAPQPRRTARRQISRRKGKAVKKVVDKHLLMEGRLCEVEVKIEKLKACRIRAKHLHDELTGSEVSPANICLHKYLTSSDLTVIRSLKNEHLELESIAGENMVHALAKLDKALKEERERLERERVQIVRQWNIIRQNH